MPVLRSRFALAALLLGILTACQPAPPAEPDESWVGTIETDGDVTTVVNRSGSVWGGNARLVERASIGVMEGEDPYMLGRIDGLWSDGEKIFVLDSQAPALRAYDWDGSYLQDIGRPGEGPGELSRPTFIDGLEGTIFVANYGTNRIALFSTDGDHIDDWQMGPSQCCLYPMVVGDDGRAYLNAREWDPRTGSGLKVMQGHGPEGPVGDPIRPPEFEVPDHTIDFGGRTMSVRYAPELVWTLGDDLTVIAGASHRYRFVMDREGSGRRVVKRSVPPLVLEGEERDWYRRATIASLRRGEPGWSWDGAEMPSVKPYFSSFLPTEDGDVWVVRPGPGRRLPQCDPDASMDDFRAFQEAACYRDTEIVDVFDGDGRFLGEIDVPDPVNLRFAHLWVKGDTVIASVYDEDGVIRVVRYEILYPDEQ